MAYLTQYSSSVPVIKFPIEQAQMSIGQDIDMDICVPEDSLADNHACLKVVQELDTTRFIIMPSDNQNSIELNGQIVEQANLQNGDWLVLGEVEFQFTDDGINEIDKSTASKLDILLKNRAESEISQPALSALNEKAPPQDVKLASATVEDDATFSRRLSLI